MSRALLDLMDRLEETRRRTIAWARQESLKYPVNVGDAIDHGTKAMSHVQGPEDRKDSQASDTPADLPLRSESGDDESVGMVKDSTLSKTSV